jgi:hypothetical protein
LFLFYTNLECKLILISGISDIKHLSISLLRPLLASLKYTNSNWGSRHWRRTNYQHLPHHWLRSRNQEEHGHHIHNSYRRVHCFYILQLWQEAWNEIKVSDRFELVYHNPANDSLWLHFRRKIFNSKAILNHYAS